eukprot:CAMPEP_0115016766 /NCGR_PEP_ID=MMETSP0216-20121206/27669_1 /TAXON_ID=223996 /ORGANISM="Protocruzia adherens, Strain Boccale" /LENGTH=167 /DNA_ID=CAMNT_0002387359 /DNA_START=219 /DNA_END=722 /DNA_ORIENTATION=+
MGIDFPNLPYYIDKNVQLTQTIAILLYVSEKFGTNLMGKTLKNRAKIFEIFGEWNDHKDLMTDVCYDRDGVDLVASGALETVVERLEYSERFIGGQVFLVGEDITWVDFFVWEQLDLILHVLPRSLDKYPKLKAYHERFRQLPELQSYFILDPLPFHNAYAPVGNTV